MRYHFGQPQQILEMYRKLCNGRQKPYEALTELFNQQTDQGQNLGPYQNLLQDATADIQKRMHRNTMKNLFADRNAEISLDLESEEPQSDYELITWLIIK